MNYTEKEIEDRCWEDYQEHAGKISLVTLVFAYINDDCHEIFLDAPIRVRIWDKLQRDSILNWTTDEWCDSSWDVELLEPNEKLDKASSLFIDGISRSTTGDVNQPKEWKLDENQLLSRYYVDRCCWGDYEKHEGKFILAKKVFFTIDDNDVSFSLDKPTRFRVGRNQQKPDVLHWENDGICSPSWDVEIAEPAYDAKTKHLYKVNRVWVAAPFMSTNGDRAASADMDWEIDSTQAISPTRPTLRSSSSTTTVCCPHCHNSIKVALSIIM
jgi:hypothetical protein